MTWCPVVAAHGLFTLVVVGRNAVLKFKSGEAT